jgi:hypothetical protein
MILCFTSAPASAGCPRLPDERVLITIQSCSFYLPSQDTNFIEEVKNHLSQNINNITQAEMADRLEQILKLNTGLLIDGKQGSEETIKRYFFRTKDNICKDFSIGNSYTFNLNYSCPMIFFEAPTKHIISF